MIPQRVLSRLKATLTKTWLFPRYIGVVYSRPALTEARQHARGTLVDVGCGLRQYEDIFAGQVSRYLGLDWPAAESQARPDVVADAMRIPLADRSVETVLATELMEHLPNPGDFLEEAARILKPGGALIITVPFLEPVHGEPRDYFRFTSYGLRSLVSEHGFEVKDLVAKGGWWSVVVGSFVTQSLYELANPIVSGDRRRYRPLIAVVVPVGAIAQWLAYRFDQIWQNPRYALGYVLVAVRRD